jgi:hypothetical protein
LAGTSGFIPTYSNVEILGEIQMALSQMQLIQSLGEAIAWLERETSWDIHPTELRHLCGRIGELYAAVITNGRMATEVNQKGYDVVSADGEHISVKTTAQIGSGGHITFNSNTLEYVDRVIVLRIDIEEKQIDTLLNAPINEAMDLMTRDANGKRTIALSRLIKAPPTRADIKTVKEIGYRGLTIRELENGSIEVERDGEICLPVKPKLRELATQLNIGLLNSNGNPLNTRQLGSQIIKSLQELATIDRTD